MFPPLTPAAIVAGASISLGFAIVALILRLITRARLVGVIAAEDAFLIAALVGHPSERQTVEKLALSSPTQLEGIVCLPRFGCGVS